MGEKSMPWRERETLCLSGKHPNVASLECAFETEELWILVMEFCDLGALDRHIRKSGNPGLDFEATARISGQVLQGLAHIHSHDILHRDVKPENIGVCRPADAP